MVNNVRTDISEIKSEPNYETPIDPMPGDILEAKYNAARDKALSWTWQNALEVGAGGFLKGALITGAIFIGVMALVAGAMGAGAIGGLAVGNIPVTTFGSGVVQGVLKATEFFVNSWQGLTTLGIGGAIGTAIETHRHHQGKMTLEQAEQEARAYKMAREMTPVQVRAPQPSLPQMQNNPPVQPPAAKVTQDTVQAQPTAPTIAPDISAVASMAAQPSATVPAADKESLENAAKEHPDLASAGHFCGCETQRRTSPKQSGSQART